MFQTVKEKIRSLVAPSTENFDSNIGISGTRRKRRCVDLDPDCQIIYPSKRQRQAEPRFQWNIRSLFDFVRGKLSSNPLEIETKTMNTVNTRKASSQPNRVVLIPSRRVQRRTGLKQISNAKILDLTQIDDEEDDDENDVQVTKVRCDLSEQANQDFTIELSSHNSFTTPAISTPNPTGKTPQSSVFLTESFRLEEKQRYKDLLAKFTDVVLPDYSESISSKQTTHSIDLTEPIPETIHASPLFYCKTFQKPVGIDLTRTELNFTYQDANKKYVDLTNVEPEVEVVEITKPVRKTKERVNTSKVSAVLDVDWIKKWRDTLDPIQLERDRRIRDEERKIEALKKKQLEEIDKLSKKDEKEFPELIADMLNKIKKALAPGNSKEVFVNGFNAEITRGDVATLRHATWLNDEVVNFYFNLIKSRSENESNLPKVHVFNTFFYPKIMKTGHASVKRWTRKVDIFAVDVILIPVHLGMHWCLAVVDFKNKEIVYYDSLKGNNGSCIQALKRYLNDESKDKKKTEFDFNGWKELMPKDIPEQMNGCDCGVFMCKYAEYKSRFAKFTFTQDNMPYFRKRMIYEILSKELM